MAVSVTVDIPEALYDRLRQTAEDLCLSIGDAILQILEREFGLPTDHGDSPSATDADGRFPTGEASGDLLPRPLAGLSRPALLC